jgi:hypothetical protein
MRIDRVGLVAMALVARLDALATTVISEPPACGEKTLKICEALRIGDPYRRVAETRRAFEEVLSSKEPEALSAVAWTVGKLKYRLDFRPYVDLLSARCGKDATRCLWQAEDGDWALLRSGSRGERLDALEHAIRYGSVRLGGGTMVQRRWAVKMAAEQGLEELQPLSEEYLATLTEARIGKLELTGVSAMFELCAGAGGYVDAARRAASRIAALPDQKFEARMTEDEGFRSAVLAIGRRVCETDPVMDAIAPECALLATVADRQRKTLAPSNVVWTGDHCWGAKENDWREKLWCSTRAHFRISPGKAAVFEPLPEATAPRKGDCRRTGVDPCGVPQLPETRGNRDVGDIWIALKEPSSSPYKEIDVSAGITGHRSGERVRFRVDVMDRHGRPPQFPVIVEVWLEGEHAGTLSHAGIVSECSRLILLWSDPEKAGYRLPERREFELTVGPQATMAGFLPAGNQSGPPVAWWRENGRLHVRVSSVDEALDGVGARRAQWFALRPEGLSSPDPHLLEAFAERIGKGRDSAIILDSDMEDRDPVVRQATRQFLLIRRSGEKKDIVEARCRAFDVEGHLSGEVRFPVHRLAGTALFVGSFTQMPHGDPEPDSAPGKGIFQPLLKLEGGTSQTECAVAE